MNEPVFDFNMKIKMRRVSPMSYTVFFILGLLCIPRALAGVFVLYIELTFSAPPDAALDDSFIVPLIIIVGIVIPLIIAVFGIGLWFSGVDTHLRFYEDHFESEGRAPKKYAANFSADYSQVERISRQNGIYILYFSKRLALLAGGSELTDPAAFESFLIRKTGKNIIYR
ncbi:MAG: hypothetical protein K2K57_05500 [Oscillospiraceae bacterium]|nr:hypothetical protein [Oscillospiraceae bacterium]